MNKRRIVLICCAAAILALGIQLLVYNHLRNQERENTTLRLAIASARGWPGMSGGFYYFVLRNDGVLISFLGLRQMGISELLGGSSLSNAFADNPFGIPFLQYVRESASIQLTDEEYLRIVNLAERLPEGGSDFEFVIFGDRAGFIEIYYNGSIYAMSYASAVGSRRGYRVQATQETMYRLFHELADLSALNVEMYSRCFLCPPD